MFEDKTSSHTSNSALIAYILLDTKGIVTAASDHSLTALFSCLEIKYAGFLYHMSGLKRTINVSFRKKMYMIRLFEYIYVFTQYIIHSGFGNRIEVKGTQTILPFYLRPQLTIST